MTRPFDRADFYQSFGGRVRAYREHRRLTQSSLAGMTGFVTQTISNIERGFTFPSLPAVLVLAEALGVHPKTLLFGGEESDDA